MNYCRVAKFVVAIPALPISAYMASLPFENPLLKLAAAIAAVALLIYAAIKIEQIPALKKKIISK